MFRKIMHVLKQISASWKRLDETAIDGFYGGNPRGRKPLDMDSPKVLNVWKFAYTYWVEMGISPSLRELSQGTGYSISSVRRCLAVLRENEILVVYKHLSRGIALHRKPPDIKAEIYVDDK